MRMFDMYLTCMIKYLWHIDVLDYPVDWLVVLKASYRLLKGSLSFPRDLIGSCLLGVNYLFG